MSLVITGATGHLGRLVIENLLELGVPADQIVAGARTLEASGMPAAFAAVYADTDRSIRQGKLIESGDLSRLIGRPTSTLSDAVAAALR